MILAINTTSDINAIALIKDKKLLTEKNWPSNRNEAETLLPYIKKLLLRNKKRFKDIKKNLVINGPGSFSKVRIGVETANTLAFILNIPIYQLNAFDIWKIQSEKFKPSVLLFPAGQKHIFAHGFRFKEKKKNKLNKGKIKEILNLFGYNFKGKIYISGSISEEQKKEIKKHQNFVWLNPQKLPAFGQTVANIALPKPISASAPLYLKEASITWSKKINVR